MYKKIIKKLNFTLFLIYIILLGFTTIIIIDFPLNFFIGILYFSILFFIIFKFFINLKLTTLPIKKNWYDFPKTPDGKRFLKPAEIGVLVDENEIVDLKDIIATIVDLAVRGYIKIEERNKDDYYLILLRKPGYNDTFFKDEKLLDYEISIIDEFFIKKNELRLRDAKIKDKLELIKEKIYNQLIKDDLFKENPEKIRKKYLTDWFVNLSLLGFNIHFIYFTDLFIKSIQKKTILGIKALNISKSLKNFLISNKIKFDFISNKKLIFEKFLPYAIVLDVEKNWAKKFKDMNLNDLTWYVGHNITDSFMLIRKISSLTDVFYF